METIVDNSSVKTVRKQQVLLDSDKARSEINESQPSEFFNERRQNILRRQKLYLRSKTTTENTIELSLYTIRSFIFVKMLKQHLTCSVVTLARFLATAPVFSTN